MICLSGDQQKFGKGSPVCIRVQANKHNILSISIDRDPDESFKLGSEELRFVQHY
jgi:hypothetical protein